MESYEYQSIEDFCQNNTMDACFKAFDKDQDNNLNINEFSALLKSIFRSDKGIPYPIESHKCTELFNIFNKSGDGSMSKLEFAYCWNNWIKKIVRPRSALVVVDVQNDFISGTLAISNCPAAEDGHDVVAPISKLVDSVPFDAFCYSLDWHPADHVSFVDNISLRKLHADSPIQNASKASVYDNVVFEGPPRTEQTLWPRHCVQNTWGAEIHKDLKVHDEAIVVRKGVHPNIDSYSAFFDNQKLGHTELDEVLRSQNITDLYICGIATDVCVASTAAHSQELGYRTILIEDCSRGIKKETIRSTFEKIRNNNGVIVNSSEVKPMVQGRDRRYELGYQYALQCRKALVYPPKNKNSRYNVVPYVDPENPGVTIPPPEHPLLPPHIVDSSVTQKSAQNHNTTKH